MPRGPVSRTPLDHYKAGPQPEPNENPYRFIYRKLGLSEEEFECRIREDIDELLNKIAAEKAPAPEEPPPRAEVPMPIEDAIPLRPLSKEECYRMLHDKTLSTGSLLGTYMWAANLGASRFNFEMPSWDEQNIHLLDAYDF